MVFMKVVRNLFMVGILLMPAVSRAAHPLITDDTGTQGMGHFQLEVNGQYDCNNENGINSTGGQTDATLTYGIADTIDLAVGIPYQWINESSGLTNSSENGFSDMVVDVKWRFFENNGFSLALKPGVSLPTGDDQKGLGTGDVGYHMYLIGTKEAAPWAFHMNLGYIYNDNKLDEEKDLWHISFATTYEIIKDLKIVADIGADKNVDKDADNDPAFVIGGLIYTLTDDFDIDCGVKYGLTSSETDLSWLAGMTFRF